MTNRAIAVAVLSAFWTVVTVAQAQTSAQQQPSAQEKPKPAPAPQQTGQVPLKVTVVISRHQGDRKISNLPYSFTVTTGERTTLNLGSEVPVVVTLTKSGDAPGVPQSFSYRPVGTSLNCLATSAGDGLFKLSLGIEDSSLHLEPGQKTAPPALVRDVPSFRSFKVNFVTLLRDGQTSQHTSATDPVTGEVMRVDLTVNVLK